MKDYYFWTKIINGKRMFIQFKVDLILSGESVIRKQQILEVLSVFVRDEVAGGIAIPESMAEVDVKRVSDGRNYSIPLWAYKEFSVECDESGNKV